MSKTKMNLIIYTGGGLSYNLVEILFRGYSHWTMFLLGGLCVLFLYKVSCYFPARPLWFKSLLGAGFITLMEFSTGYLVNIRLGWQVWDYSLQHFNLLGQISLLFSLIWFVLSGCVFVLISTLQKRFAGGAWEYKESR